MLNILKFLKILFNTGHLRLAAFFAEWEGAANLQLIKQVSMVGKDGILFKPTQSVFTSKTWPLFAKSLSLLQQAALLYQAQEHNGTLWLQTNCHGHTIKAAMANPESLMCMHEIFGKQVYNIEGFKNMVVIDIGANIGLASLFFACQPTVEAVYGFELVGSSSKTALQNVADNEVGRNKVTIEHAGIANLGGTIEIPLTGTGDVGAHIGMKTLGGATEKVMVKSITQVVSDVRSRHPAAFIIIKMDCEGAEYEIINQLQKDQLQPYIQALVIEWHLNGSKPITDVLGHLGFVCFTPGIEAAQPTGFVYAVKK